MLQVIASELEENPPDYLENLPKECEDIITLFYSALNQEGLEISQLDELVITSFESPYDYFYRLYHWLFLKKQYVEDHQKAYPTSVKCWIY